MNEEQHQGELGRLAQEQEKAAIAESVATVREACRIPILMARESIRTRDTLMLSEIISNFQTQFKTLEASSGRWLLPNAKLDMPDHIHAFPSRISIHDICPRRMEFLTFVLPDLYSDWEEFDFEMSQERPGGCHQFDPNTPKNVNARAALQRNVDSAKKTLNQLYEFINDQQLLTKKMKLHFEKELINYNIE